MTNSCLFCSVSITFIERDGSEHVVKAKSGDTLLEVAKEHDIDVEGTEK